MRGPCWRRDRACRISELQSSFSACWQSRLLPYRRWGPQLCSRLEAGLAQSVCEQSKVIPLFNKSSWDPLLCQAWGSVLWPLTSQAPGLVGGIPTPMKEQPQVKSWAFIVGTWGGAAHSGRESTRPHWDSSHSQVHWLDDTRLSFRIPAYGTILSFCIFHSSTQVGSRCCIFWS